jgi:hypothetical protein
MNEEIVETPQELTPTQRELVSKYYEDALTIAQSFKSSVLFDDEKENIAVRVLIRVSRHYDPNFKFDPAKRKHLPKAGRTLFNTLLHRSIVNALISAGHVYKDGTWKNVQKKRMPKAQIINESVIEANAAERGQVKNLSTMLSMKDNTYNIEHEQLLSIIKARLTERQGFILDVLVAPELFGMPFSKSGTPKATNLFIAQKFGITKQRINQEIIEIRRIAKVIIENSDSRFLKVNQEQ